MYSFTGALLEMYSNRVLPFPLNYAKATLMTKSLSNYYS